MELLQEADRSKWMVHSNHSTQCFAKGDIDRMTNNYRTSLGSGAFGEVYEGVLEDGSMVAVKRFIHNMKENFAKELIVHREINHKNVVRLIGYCVEENALMLVTKYMANGNLSDALHYDNSPFPLDVRLRIAIDCAEALAYMHSHMYTHVIHGDIKPANILLDGNFHAKLTDFGISRLVNTDTTLYTKNVIGSIGYMDPLFARDGLLTSKSDVYSFGVVLFELIARKKATTVVNSVHIVSAFTDALARGTRGVREMFDTEIANKDNTKIVEGVAKIAGECLILERDKRLKMIDVVERLRVLMKTLHQDQGQHRVDLFSWLTKHPPLTWNRRLEICIGAARGLHGLHSSQIIHGNVQTKKILLNEEWVVKIADLSFSKTDPTENTRVAGTAGYIDPEYLMTGQISEKSDVYSFGAVLFKVLYARSFFDPNLPSEQMSLLGWASQSKEGNVDQIIDPYLKGRINPWSLNKFVETAEKCVADHSIDRPSMADVISNLEYALQLQASAGPAGTW